MKHLLTAMALTGLLTLAAEAQSSPCKAPAEAAGETDARAACKKPAGKARAVESGSGLTPADKDILDRAHTRSLLENIESETRRLRMNR